jgi:hypothetical protein
MDDDELERELARAPASFTVTGKLQSSMQMSGRKTLQLNALHVISPSTLWLEAGAVTDYGSTLFAATPYE